MWNLNEQTFWAIHNTQSGIKTFYTEDIRKKEFKMNVNNLVEITYTPFNITLLVNRVI